MKTFALWLAALCVAIVVGAVAAHEVAIADEEDAAALASREFAGQAVCGPNATPDWLDDKTLVCLKHVGPAIPVNSSHP